MGSRTAAIAVALMLATAAPLAYAGGPSAADRETARTLMDEGFRLRDAKDLKGALERFSAADQIMHVPSTAYEVAATQLALGMLVEASDTASRILAVQAKPHDPLPFRQARRKAQKLVDSLDGRIPSVTITLEGPKPDDTLKLTIDGAEIPTAVVGLPRTVDPGHHLIAATTSTSHGEGTVDLKEGEQKKLTITLKLLPKTAVAKHVEPTHVQVVATPTPPPSTQGKGGRIAAFVSFGLAGAAAIAGGVTGVLTMTTRADLASKCTDHLCDPSLSGEISDGNTFAWISTFAFAGAGAALVVGVIALAVSGHHHNVPVESARVVPWIGVGAAGLTGTF
jgi:hypothetical protein